MYSYECPHNYLKTPRHTSQRMSVIKSPYTHKEYVTLDEECKQLNPDDACCLACGKSCMSRSSISDRYMAFQGTWEVTHGEDIDVVYMCDRCYRGDFDMHDRIIFKRSRKVFVIDSIDRMD